MPAETPEAVPERIIALAPFGRDLHVVVSLLARHGFEVAGCAADADELHDVLQPGADVIVLTAEAFRSPVLDMLRTHLYAEPVWSMPPFVLIAENRVNAERVSSTLRKVRPGLPVSILIRPCAEIEVASAVGVAVETRRQQILVKDLIARHECAERQAKFLLGELSHRVKNLFNMVLAIATQTSKAAADGKTFRERFRGRIMALANTYAVLQDGDWHGADLGQVIAKSIDPLLTPGEENRLLTQGPHVRLSANLASSLGLVMHELALNARKYGALSGSNGHVDVVWQAEANWVTLEWTEHGGPAVTPPSKQGFGTTVITRSMASIPGTEVDLSYPPEGIVCRIVFNREADTAA